MGTQVHQLKPLRDVVQGPHPSRLRLLAPIRYLSIQHPEKTKYDFALPLVFGVIAWAIYWLLNPKPPLFGDDGLLRFTRDLLIMAVPFMIGALAAVAMGSPGEHMDTRPRGVDLRLDGRTLTLRQFVCYLLGYLSFVGLITLGASVAAALMHNTVVHWLVQSPKWLLLLKAFGTLVLSVMLSALTITVFWGLYFLTDIVNDAD
ncbi:MAG TPA: hypothetical protein VMF67_19205 [Rhizomicrobium sp.]|nr:hypothetical protein [Rhizomicrobium sp.]